MTQVGETSVPTTTAPLDLQREHSARVLDHLVTHGPATRSELAAVTGLGRGAIAGLTSRLLDAGVLRTGLPDAAGDGRAAPLSLAAAHHVLVTAHLGRDDAIATVATLGGEELARFTTPLTRPWRIGYDDEAPDAPGAPGDERWPTPLESLAVVLGRAIARSDRAEHPVADVTVLVDGIVVGSPEVVIADSRLGAEPLDLLGELRERTPGLGDVEAALPVPVALVPTSVVAAAAERVELHGVGDLLFISGDDAVSAAVISEGRPLRGAHGLAATFGHLPIVQGGVRCDCGQRGCLATVASTEVVLERARLDTFAAQHGRLAALDELVTRVEAAEDRARWAWLDAALWIGRALQVVVPTIDPATVVIGGYWARLADDIETAFRDNRPTIGGGALGSIPTLTPARLGDDGVLVGARLQARERLVADPALLAG